MSRTISQTLQEAQKILLEKRTEARQWRLTQGLPVDQCLDWETSQKPALQLAADFIQPSTAEQINSLPAHLGWETAGATAAIRTALRRHETQEKGAETNFWAEKQRLLLEAAAHAPQTPPQTAENGRRRLEYAKLYPDIALGMLREEQAASGRIWWLLRTMDAQGRGWLFLDDVRALLTRKGAALHVCGWRQLRNLLQQGEGMFWRRDKTRLWLLSAAKVATSLNVSRLTALPVSLPLSILLGGAGEMKAHFYASFHSGRRSNMPISRETLEIVTSIPGRTQRAYDKVAGVGRQYNIAVGERYTTENVQKRAWCQNGSFDFIDHHGRQGPEKRHYIAWHLPNSYEGCHERCPKGRMKKINQQIDLVNERAQGNGTRVRLFHTNGAQAARSHSRNTAIDAFWHSEYGQLKRKESLWHVLPQEEGDI